MTRDRLENAMRRLHSDALATTTIDVYEPAESYSPGDGVDVTYPDSPSATYDARVEQPSDDTDTDRSGTTAEVDAVIRVRDDTGQDWTGFGEDGEAATHVVDTDTGARDEVQGVTDAKDGVITLEVAEV